MPPQQTSRDIDNDDDDPSRWGRRLPPVGLALAGCGISSYLTLYQLGVVPHVWDPVFGGGSRKILHSKIARLLPVPDASLGAAGYLFEAALGLAAGAHRWRTRPGIVLGYGVVAEGFAAGSVALALAQVFYFRAGCLLCLASAGLSLANGALIAAEPLASLRLVRQERRRGVSLWAALRGRREHPATRHLSGAAAAG